MKIYAERSDLYGRQTVSRRSLTYSGKDRGYHECTSSTEYNTTESIPGYGELPDAKKFTDLLETFGLVQHVNVPTHTSGHTLDLIISRSNNDITISSPRTSLFLSDHSFIECELDIIRPILSVGEVHFRKLKKIDIDTFKADISASKPEEASHRCAKHHGRALTFKIKALHLILTSEARTSRCC